MNESALPLRQANTSHMLGYDETYAEIMESNAAVVSQRGTQRQTGRGDPGGQLPPISFTTGMQRRTGVVTGGLGAAIHQSKKGLNSEVASNASK